MLSFSVHSHVLTAVSISRTRIGGASLVCRQPHPRWWSVSRPRSGTALRACGLCQVQSGRVPGTYSYSRVLLLDLMLVSDKYGSSIMVTGRRSLHERGVSKTSSTGLYRYELNTAREKTQYGGAVQAQSTHWTCSSHDHSKIVGISILEVCTRLALHTAQAWKPSLTAVTGDTGLVALSGPADNGGS